MTYHPLIILLGAATLLSLGCSSKPAMMEATMAPSLMLSDQARSDSVVIQSFTLDKPGYVVIHQDGGGKPGPVIGVSELIQPGSYENYSVSIDATAAGDRVFPMLHYDNGDGTYEFPGPDGPVKAGDKVLVGPVNWQ